MARKWIIVLRSFFHFSWNPANVTSNSIFPYKNASKITKITRFELLWGPFIDRYQASRRVLKIMQNYAKIHIKSPHEKIWHPVLQWSKTHAVERPAKMHQNAFIFVAPGVDLLTPWMQKPFKIVDNDRCGHVRCLRSGPPRGVPIRSVFYYMEK